MATQALYRKHRSQSFAEVIGQDHVTKSLLSALKSGRINHAYLFCGPRGVGKTSTARLLGQELNQGEGESSLDLIEIDAASNNSVEEIRDLREKAFIGPAKGTYKIYIIDEVHMLSKAAFNAFLKILEEPPQHVVFILATTEPHKLPATIISRTQQYFFRPVTADVIAAHVKQIAKKEKISIDDEAALLIGQAAEGSVRDALSLLDQLSVMTDQITATEAERLLGRASHERLLQLLRHVLSQDAQQTLAALDEFWQHGHEATQLTKQLITAAHQLLRNRINGTADTLPEASIASLKDLIMELQSILKYQEHTDIALEAVLANRASGGAALAAPAVEKVAQASASPAKPVAEAATPAMMEKQTEPVTALPKKTTKARPAGTIDDDTWHRILSAVRDRSPSLYALLRASAPGDFDEESLHLAFKFRFHERRMQEAKNLQTIEGIITEVVSRPIRITTEHGADLPPLETQVPVPSGAPAMSEAESVESILRVIGGEVVDGQ